jgi:hypothetical protein
MLKISATQEGKIGKTEVQDQTRQKVNKTPSQQISQLWWCMLAGDIK